jgi:nitrite reductase/ring-hydroxylating ferredoxin subunit/thioredoxin reductase
MSASQSPPAGPDLTLGVTIDTLPAGAMVAGHVGDDAVLLARHGDEFFAIGATCSHYGGPLAEGLLVDDTVRCPWHHACFSLRTGEALHAPALSPVACWTTEQRDGQVFVRAKEERPPQLRVAAVPTRPRRIVIVGGGAAGFAAAEMLRRQRNERSITMLSDDAAAPVDRPNLSKDYLAGTAPEEWVPLRDDSFYADQKIDLRLECSVAAIDLAGHAVVTADGSRIAYERLLLATGAEPVRLRLPGMDLLHVHTLRTLADSRAIIAQSANARTAVVMGASFIGLEVAASLRTRGIEVHVVAPDKRPMERVLGPQMGDFVRGLHEAHGVIFHLQDTASAIARDSVTLESGTTLRADLVVVGVGVRPRLDLAQHAGLAIDRGVSVDEYLETNAPDVFAACVIARWQETQIEEEIS